MIKSNLCAVLGLAFTFLVSGCAFSVAGQAEDKADAAPAVINVAGASSLGDSAPADAGVATVNPTDVEVIVPSLVNGTGGAAAIIAATTVVTASSQIADGTGGAAAVVEPITVTEQGNAIAAAETSTGGAASVATTAATTSAALVTGTGGSSATSATTASISATGGSSPAATTAPAGTGGTASVAATSTAAIVVMPVLKGSDVIKATAARVLSNDGTYKSTCTLRFSGEYLLGGQATKAGLKGYLPSHVIGYESTEQLTKDDDGYFSKTFDVSEMTYTGDYEVAYGAISQVNGQVSFKYADFGMRETLAAMTAEGRSWVACNWYDAVKQADVYVDPAKASCGLKVSVATDGTTCSFHPAGNMATFSS